MPPDVVNADEDAEDIGLVVDAVPLPPFFEVSDIVAGDASVDDIEVVCWAFCQEEIGDEVDIATAEGLAGAEVSVGVGDAVADEENFFIGR